MKKIFSQNLNAKIQKWITPKTLSIFLTVIYLLSLIPILWIGWFNYPSADDYTIGSNCRWAWVSSHNFFNALWAGIERSVEDYLHWMGYFTSNFLMAMSPGSFGERFYILTVWIMLLMLSLSTIYLLKTIFTKVFMADKHTSRCVYMLVLLITVQCMVGRVEAFFWYSGAVNYMFVHGMSLFFYGLLISAVYDGGKKRAIKLAAASFLGFFTGGGNQMTALNVCIVLTVTVIFLTYNRKWKKYKGFAVPMGMFFLGFVLNVASPGNLVRAEGASGMNPVKAVLVSFYYCLDYCISKWSGWPVILLVIILVPLFWHMTEKTQFQFPCPLVVVLFGYCVVSAMITPPVFALGNIGAARLQALTFTMYLLALTLCTGYVTGWARKRLSPLQQLDRQPKNLSFTASEIWCLLGCLFFLGAASLITVIPEPHCFTASSAITDLINGDAKAYGDALRARAKLYNSGEKNVTVEPLPCYPQLLYFSDIKEDASDWENLGVCKFYGLDSVTKLP